MINLDEKFIYFQDQSTHQANIYKVECSDIFQNYQKYPNMGIETDIGCLVVDISRFIPETQVCKIQRLNFFDSLSNSYQIAQKKSQNLYNIPIQCFQLNVIMLRYRSFNQELNIQSEQKLQKKQIKQRDRLRTILDVLLYVKNWRNLTKIKKITLQESAQLVGISKKSLDDYYYHLRLAEQRQFDFSGNLHKNYSILRKFVKQKIPSRQRKKQNKKLPKQLKILDEIQQPSLANAQNQLKSLKQNNKESDNQKYSINNSISHYLGIIGLQNNQHYDENDSFFRQFRFQQDNFDVFSDLNHNSENIPQKF